MSTFAEAVQNTPCESLTANGMLTFDSSLDPCVDLFFQISSSRGKDLTPQFERAFQANPTAALRIMFWARDIRGGAGERDTFRKLLVYLEKSHPETLEKVIHLIPDYGRWDDGFVFETNRFKKLYADIVSTTLLVGKAILNNNV